MSTICLYVEAPFAVARPFVAGWYRPTAGFLSHSSIYGLLLNIAGIDSRVWEHDVKHDGKTPASLMRTDPKMPRFQLALGVPIRAEPPKCQTLYQQLHTYLQDETKVPDPDNPEQKIKKSEEGFKRAKGNKFAIRPVRRELLSDIKAVIAVDADDVFREQLRYGLRGEGSRKYGLPFLGDNNLLIDRLEEIQPGPTRWYARVEDESGRPRQHVTRLTIWIDRAIMANTKSGLFALTDEPSADPPKMAWTKVGPPSS